METPLKLTMFFTEPRILKFEFDNSYSWFRSKTIKFKTNIFYSKYPYKINENILMEKYIKDITKVKKNINKKNKEKIKASDNNNIADKLLIIKLNGNSKVFNCKNVEENLKAINLMEKNKYFIIISLFIKIKEKEEDKSYFYFYSKENNENLIEKELTQENFQNYLNQVILTNKNLSVINLYIMNKNTKVNLEEYSLKNILGFNLILKAEGSFQKLLIFVQNLNQAQILYYIYKQINNNELIDNLIFINITKYSGFQVSFYNKEEIIDLNEEFKGLNKEVTLEENEKIICQGIKNLKLDEEKKLAIVLGNCGDNKDSDDFLDKLKEILTKNEEMKNANFNVVKTEVEFNEEFMSNSHVFYLDK